MRAKRNLSRVLDPKGRGQAADLAPQRTAWRSCSGSWARGVGSCVIFSPSAPEAGGLRCKRFRHASSWFSGLTQSLGQRARVASELPQPLAGGEGLRGVPAVPVVAVEPALRSAGPWCATMHLPVTTGDRHGVLHSERRRVPAMPVGLLRGRPNYRPPLVIHSAAQRIEISEDQNQGREPYDRADQA